MIFDPTALGVALIAVTVISWFCGYLLGYEKRSRLADEELEAIQRRMKP